MKKILLIFLVLSSIHAYSQFGDMGANPSFLDRVFIGGGMDLAISQDYLLIGASPSLGYMITNSTAIGAGITYRYIRFPQINETANVLGYRFFLQQMLFKNVFAYAEWENLGYKSYIDITRYWDHRTHIGGGIYQPISPKAGFMAIVLYRVSTSAAQDQFNSPLSYRAGLTYSPFRRR